MAEVQLQLRALTAGEVLISQTTEAALLSLQALKNAALKGSPFAPSAESTPKIMLLFIPVPARTRVAMMTKLCLLLEQTLNDQHFK